MSAVARTILVTGASSGIGRATARHLLNTGHHIIGTSRQPEKFTRPHPEFSPQRLDLSITQSFSPFCKNLIRQHPSVDAVVFSAGYGQFGGLEEFSHSQIQHLMQVNFIAQAQLTRSLLPHLKKQARSHLIYIGSEAALEGNRKGSIYCASKFALRGFTQALRDECGNSSTRVSLINPGMVQTAFFDDLNFMPGEESGQSIQAEDIANLIEHILHAEHHFNFDEINLSPANKVIRFKGKNR